MRKPRWRQRSACSSAASGVTTLRSAPPGGDSAASRSAVRATAVPALPTTMPEAMLASRAATGSDSPAASPAATVATSASRLPETS
jgi:hypothetical protein